MGGINRIVKDLLISTIPTIEPSALIIWGKIRSGLDKKQLSNSFKQIFLVDMLKKKRADKRNAYQP